MRKDVKKAVSWIETFMKKVANEASRIDHVDETIDTEVEGLEEQITDLRGDQSVLKEAKKKVENLLKILNGD